MSNKKVTKKELKSKIYAKYYELNPDGDARFGLWKAVLDAKTIKDLQDLYEMVEQGYF
jgi:hypothetical protein